MKKVRRKMGVDELGKKETVEKNLTWRDDSEMGRRGRVQNSRLTIKIRLKRISFFFQAEDGIRDAQKSRGLGEVYKRQTITTIFLCS